MADVIYNSFKQKIMDGSIDLDSDTIKVALVTSSYVPDADSHESFSDVTNEISGTGYTAGGATLANVSITKDTTNDWGKFDADDTSWSASSIIARGAIVYKSSGTDATSWLICYKDFLVNKSSSTGVFTIQWGDNGILYLN